MNGSADLEHRAWALWAADCAGRVLSHFERERPTDDRPRRAIAAARAWVRGELAMADARAAAFGAHGAAREAPPGPARAAARSAGHAAATAHVADHARHAADYAVKATGPEEREWQAMQLAQINGTCRSEKGTESALSNYRKNG